jgi:hypothetical protein
MDKKLLYIIAAAVIIVVAAGSFYGGMTYGKSTTKDARFGQGIPTGINNKNGGNVNGGDNSGEIILKDDISITIKLVSGGSKIIMLSESTKINKMAEGSLGDLEIGTNVTVQGTKNTDGSVTAQSIQIKPGLNQQNLLK